MVKRVVIASVLGGLTMFLWLFVAHELTPLGEMGVDEIPNEAAVVGAMEAAIPRSGLFLFPGFGLGPNPTMEQRNSAMPAYMKNYEKVPHGMLIYHPASGPLNFGALLAREGSLNLLEAFLAALLLSCAAAGKKYGQRAGFVAILGVLAALTTNVEYWNWYEFPGKYTAGYMVTQLIGFALMGLVLAAIVKSESALGS